MANLEKFKSVLTRIAEFMKKHGLYINNALILIFMVAFEDFFEHIIFRCPCDPESAKLYGWCFIFAPAVVFFVIGSMATCLKSRVVFEERNESVETSSEERNESAEKSSEEKKPTQQLIMTSAIEGRNESAKTLSERKKPTQKLIKTSAIRISFSKVIKCLAAPCAWIFVTFMDGHYYACSMSQNPCGLDIMLINETIEVGDKIVIVGSKIVVPLSEIKAESSYAETVENRSLESWSQTIGWFVFGVTAILIALGTLIVRLSKNTLTQERYFSKLYLKSEGKCIIKASQENAKALAQKNVDSFFKREKITRKDWIAVATEPLTTEDCTDDAVLVHSPLHKWLVCHPPEEKKGPEVAVEQTPQPEPEN